jgi:hypothetical protein
MRWKRFAIATWVVGCVIVGGDAAFARSRIFHCVGPNGELVFRDAPCSRVGLAKVGEVRPDPFRPSEQKIDPSARCLFESRPLPLIDPVFEHTELRLIVDIDAEGPYLQIVASGEYFLAADKREPATFDARVSSQGLQMLSGAFHDAEWRMGEQTLGFGRSRMRSLLTALSREEATVLVWFEGFAQPVQSASIPAEEFRLAVDNLRRCWKAKAPDLANGKIGSEPGEK